MGENNKKINEGNQKYDWSLNFQKLLKVEKDYFENKNMFNYFMHKFLIIEIDNILFKNSF